MVALQRGLRKGTKPPEWTRRRDKTCGNTVTGAPRGGREGDGGKVATAGSGLKKWQPALGIVEGTLVPREGHRTVRLRVSHG